MTNSKKLAGALCVVASLIFQVSAHAQTARFVTADDEAKAPYIICHATNNDAGVGYATPRAPNDPQGRARFDYHREELKKKTGLELRGVCSQHHKLGDEYGKQFTPGQTWVDGANRRITVREFPGLSANWSKEPVPGEKKPSGPEGPLKTLTLLYPSGRPDAPGYDFATIEVKYRFIACSGEVHAAYSLDPESVRVGDRYMTKDGEIPVDGASTPRPPSIELKATVVPDLSSSSLMEIDVRHRYGQISDPYAGPSLGFGCFTGQSQKVGMVADIVKGKHEPDRLNAILHESLALEPAIKGMAFTDRPLRNASLEGRAKQAVAEAEAKAAAQAEAERLAAEKALADRWAKSKAESDAFAARVEAERKAHADAVAKYERETAAVKAAEAKFARDKAAHDAAVAKAAAEKAEYDRQMAEYRRKHGGG